VIDPAALQMVLMVLTGWLDRRERQAIAYLIEEIASCGVSLADGGCVSRMTIGAGWSRERTWWAVRPCGRLPRSRRPTPCSGGIAS
jgi:hypothetical protein